MAKNNDDLAALFDSAVEAGENNGEGGKAAAFIHGGPNKVEEPKVQEQTTTVKPEPVVEPEPVIEKEPEPVVEPEPTVHTVETEPEVKPAKKTKQTKVTTPPIVSTSAPHRAVNNVKTINSIILTLDAYREYPQNTQVSISKYFGAETEGEIIYSVLNETEDRKDSLFGITQCLGAEPVDRAFYLMGLDIHILNVIGDVLSSYAETEMGEEPVEENKIAYSRRIVQIMGELNDPQISDLMSIQELINYSESTQN